LDYEERRKQEKVAVDQELQELKQRQAERRKEWEADERKFAELRRQDDEKRKQEQEERKAKIEAEKARREDEKLRRQQAMTGAFVGGGSGAKPGRNFVVTKKGGSAQAAGGEQARGPSGRKVKSPEEIEAEKRNYMSIVGRQIDVSSLLPNDLKAKIKQLHARITRLESEKYDVGPNFASLHLLA
jgi:troponin T